MGQGDKGVINEPFRASRLERGCFKGFVFKMFDENICNNRKEGRTHGSTFSLFIKLTLVTKEGRLKANFDKVDKFLIDKIAGNFYGFFYRDFGKQRDDIEIDKDVKRC